MPAPPHSTFRSTFEPATNLRMIEKPATHTAYAVRRENPNDPLRRERRAKAYWMEVGSARIDTASNEHHVFLDRLPLGGFTGHIYLSPIGTKPPELETQPERPTGEDSR
jgi:hypothetical protein